MAMDKFSFLVLTFLVFGAASSWCCCISWNKLVDLSYPFDESTIGWLKDRPFELNITKKGYLPGGYWIQDEEYCSATHVGTHFEAPCHMAEGKWSVDEIPLERLVARAAVIDITCRVNMDCNALLLVQDLMKWERMTGETLDDTIILVRTGWSRRWPNKQAYIGNTNNDIKNLCFPGVSADAAAWIVNNRRVYGVGIESFSLDSGINVSGEKPAHRILERANVYGIENVASLVQLPICGATVQAFPIKLKGACAGPVRVVAYVP